MRSLAPCLLSLLLAATATAQVRTSLLIDPGSEKQPAIARLTIVIEPGWHISSLTQPDGGPLRTTVEIPRDQSYRLAGKISGPPPRTEHSPVFDLEVQTYEGRVEFVLPLEKNPAAKGASSTSLTVEITYQACSDETCLLPQTDRITAQGRKP